MFFRQTLVAAPGHISGFGNIRPVGHGEVFKNARRQFIVALIEEVVADSSRNVLPCRGKVCEQAEQHFVNGRRAHEASDQRESGLGFGRLIGVRVTFEIDLILPQRRRAVARQFVCSGQRELEQLPAHL